MVLCLLLVHQAYTQQTHPRLFFGPNDIPQLRARAHASLETPSRQIWELVKEMQADYFSDPDNQILLCNDVWQMENAFALALAVVIEDPNHAPYLTALKNVLFGTGPILPSQALVNRLPSGDVERYRTAQILTLSTVADVCWTYLTEGERIQIALKVSAEIDAAQRDTIFSPIAHIRNNHIVRWCQPVAAAAITFHDLEYGGGIHVYPQALSDLERVQKLIVTDLNGKKNVIERLYDTEGSCVEGFEYALYGLTRSIPLIAMLSRYYNYDYFSAPQIQQRLSKVANWVCYEVIPGPAARSLVNIANNINDSDVGDGWHPSNGVSILTSLLALGGYYGTQTTQWAFENTVETVANLQLSEDADHQRYSKATAHLISLLKYDPLNLVAPESVLPKSKFFPERGLVVVRSSNTWADDSDIQFALEGAPCINPANGSFSIKHDQADKGHFTLAAFGKRYIRDYGRGEAYGGKRPETHNYILIDEKGQAIDTYIDIDTVNGVPVQVEKDNWQPRPGKFISHVYDGRYTFAHHDAKGAFDTLFHHDHLGNAVRLTTNPPLQSSGLNAYVNPVQNADRFAFFIQSQSSNLPAYIVIADDIRKDNSARDYKWLFHSNYTLSGANPYTLTADSDKLILWFAQYTQPKAAGPQIQEIVHQPAVSQELRTSTSGETALDALGTPSEPSLSYRHFLPLFHGVNPYFHVVMYPKKSGMPGTPAVTFPESQGGNAIRIPWSGYEDFSLFKYASSPVMAGGISSNGRLTHVRRTSPGGQVNSFALGEGGLLSSNGTTLVDLFGATGTVLMSGDTLRITGTGISDFVVYAPSATAVRVNGSPVPFVKAGNNVEAATVSHNRSWTGSVTVATGTTLTILPGITITCSPGTAVTINGRFLAQGTAQSRIKFTSTSPTTTWSGIVLNGSGANNSIAEYCTVERVQTYSGSAFAVVGATGFRMSRCTIRNNTTTLTNGVVLTNAGSPELDHNSITGNGAYGVRYQNTSGYFYADTVTGNVTGGVSCNSSSNVMFGKVGFPAYNGNCIISGGSYGVYAVGNSNPTIGTQSSSYYGYNSITGTSTARVYAANSNVLAEKNWWGANPPQASWFVTSNGAIDWNPYLTSNPVGTLLMPSPAPDPDANAPPSLALTPADVDPLSEVRDARLRGDYDQALSLLSKMNIASSDKHLSLRYVGELLAIGHFQFDPSLIELAEKAVEVMGQGTWEELTLARLLEIGGMSEKAEAIFKQLSSDAKDAEIQKEAALALFFSCFQTQRFNEADDILSERSTKWGEDEAGAYGRWLMSIVSGGELNKPAVLPGSVNVEAPDEMELASYPNPFNPSTTIRFSLPQASRVNLTVFNTLGEKVVTLVNEEKAAGVHNVRFDASSLASGVYLYRLTAGDNVLTRKVIVLR